MRKWRNEVREKEGWKKYKKRKRKNSKRMRIKNN